MAKKYEHEYALLEWLEGELNNKLHCLEIGELSNLKNRKKEIIDLRISKPLFDGKPDRKELEEKLIIIKRVD